ncbi:hypothetical protein T459_33725 [Capsicum annuum]|uniref:Uncharacterized protein n=1 Tax=Capsicum annuum TaxID=4072 RepID=A0A2G2XY87_CAPAN|nr:hypothetical protein T459_33725 [Capsicum annuum]
MRQEVWELAKKYEEERKRRMEEERCRMTLESDIRKFKAQVNTLIKLPHSPPLALMMMVERMRRMERSIRCCCFSERNGNSELKFRDRNFSGNVGQPQVDEVKNCSSESRSFENVNNGIEGGERDDLRKKVEELNFVSWFGFFEYGLSLILNRIK